MNRLKTYYFYAIVMSSTLTSCKKDISDILFPKNNSFVECTINGKRVYGEGVRNPFEPQTTFHMNYYSDKDAFTFNIAKNIYSEDKTERYNIMISVCLSDLPIIGERMYFKKSVDNDMVYEFEDNSFIATIESYPYLYECTDTLKLPEPIRKKRLSIRSTKTDGYIEFTKLDAAGGYISGKFEFEAEAKSKIIDGVIIKISAKQGTFEGYKLERDKTFYTPGLPETLF